MEVIKIQDWKNKGNKLFGDVKNWKMECPYCGNIQTLQEFIDAKIEEPENKFYYSCIGRWVKGKGCDYTLGEGIRINKTKVENEAGEKIPVFEFAE